MAKILIVEDDPVIRQLVRDALETERHVVDDCQDGRSGMAFIDAGSYELLVLDWEMPHATGIELCSHFRNQGEQAPVLFLTARASMDDKEKGFAVGADDYLTKPFDVRELLVRVKALLKRPQQISKDILKVGAMELDTNSGVVKRNDALIRLQPRELALLEFLMRHPDTFFTAEALMTRVWDTDSEATEVALRSCIAKLRRKMDVEGQSSFIETSKGLGYRINSKS
ncbi:MAG: response regulator transcription factor [Candidatus Melainabacteria bacterium]|nr:response regulator transcription factor [Candidatus Melainabacteria bacterium]